MAPHAVSRVVTTSLRNRSDFMRRYICWREPGIQRFFRKISDRHTFEGTIHS